MEKSTIEQILAERHYLMFHEEPVFTTDEQKAYYEAYLLCNYGISVDKPKYLNASALKDIATIMDINVPKSFYKNPQDTKYFSAEELAVEQLVSYFIIEMSGVKDDENPEKYNRIEIFKKTLPDYVVGDEINVREFKMIASEEEKTQILKSIYDAYCSYTRPFGLMEEDEFRTLYENYRTESTLKCKNNIFNLLDLNKDWAKQLDLKDIVNYSINTIGDVKYIPKQTAAYDKVIEKFKEVFPVAQICPLTKKQAKYLNKLVSLSGVSNENIFSNMFSPHRMAKVALDFKNVYAAAKIYNRYGSLLERNLVYLLSRSDAETAGKILDLVKAKNPVVLMQLVAGLCSQNTGARTFVFKHNKLTSSHVETEYETKWRKSRLSPEIINLLQEYCTEKVKEAYSKFPVGKVYIDDSFYNIALPFNTSTAGKGLDVLPEGSRIRCTADNIRTFVYWTDNYDIDASLILIDNDGKPDMIYFGNYSHKKYGDDILFSGDCRAKDGAEYYDIKLDAMRNRGVRYIIQTFHGFGGTLDKGKIICGYQNKNNLDTEVWDPKNIEMQFRVIGDSRACAAFAIDLETKEVIILNRIEDSDNNVVDPSQKNALLKILDKNYLKQNIGLIAEYRGTKVSTPEEADIVFSDTCKLENKNIIHTYDLEKFVALINNAEL